MESLNRLLQAAKEYPLEITLASGDKHSIPHSDYIHRHPNGRHFVLYPEKGEYYSITIDPYHVVQVARVGRKHRPVPV
ncbi:MAG: hypothetical protein FJ399_11745 [Verrucomicrobia bacterium]|nr:hypothetical protein [Verrucomicrobiota bacterium]